MSIRYCGLHDKNTKGLNHFIKRFEERGNSALDISRKFISKKTYRILEHSIQVPQYEKHGVVLLPCSLYKKLKSQKKIPQDPLFDKKIKGYNVRLGFVKSYKKEGSSIIASLFIDDKVIQSTTKEIGDEGFKTLEKALGYIYVLSNHDSSIHSTGFVVGDDKFSYTNAVCSEQFDGYREEDFAIMFHKYLFEELAKTSDIKNQLLSQVKKIFNLISNIQDENVRYYWNQVLKNGLFMLLSPEDKELQKIKAKYPNLNLSAGPYIKKIHQKELKTNDFDNIISIKKLAQATTKSIKSNDIPWDLIELIKGNQIDYDFETLKYDVHRKTQINFRGKCSSQTKKVMESIKVGEFKNDIGSIIRNCGNMKTFIDTLAHLPNIDEILYKIGNKRTYRKRPKKILSLVVNQHHDKNKNKFLHHWNKLKVHFVTEKKQN